MSTHKNLITLCFAVVFALGLAACGGGGSGPAPMADNGDTDGADNGDTDGDVSLVGRYIPSGFSLEGLEGLDLPDGTTISVANGESVDVADLVTAECVSDDGCSATVAGDVLTIMGNLKIVSVDPALDDASVAELAKVFPVMLPDGDGDGDANTPAEILADARTALAALPDDATDEAKETAQGLVDMALRLPGNEAELIASLDEKVADAEERLLALDLTEQERTENAVALQNAKDALTSASAEGKEAAQAAVDEALRLPGNEAALIASLNEIIKAAEQKTAETAAATALAERIAREEMVRTAIELTDNRVGTSEKEFPTGITEQAVARDAADKLTVDVNGEADDVYAGGETTAGDGDWSFVMLTKTDDDAEATDTVVFYTDIAAPADKLLTAQYTQTQLDDSLDTDTVEKAMSAGFPSEPGTSWVYTGADDERAKTVTGTFDGVPGQFTCTSTEDCTVATNSDGELMPSDDWRFTPVSPLTATVKDPDMAYAYFGWWLNKPEDNTAAHDVEVFAGGTTDHEADVTIAIEGTATYAGPAAGKYVTRTFTAGVHSDSGVGHFTADATLTAKFGDENEPGTIGGSVTGFELDDTKPVSWKVTLEDAALTNNTATFNGTSEVNFGGGATEDDAGTWQGSFYDDADATDDTNAPGTVAGTFDALTENASVIGGFGATKR